MKQSHKFAAGVVASLGLGIAVAVAYAQPGPMGGGMEHGKGGMQHGMKGGMGPGAMNGGPAGPAAAQQLMTPEERTAIIEKMRNAKTPEERQQIVAANQAEMQKRAKEKGITLPEHRGPHFGGTPQAPAAN
jgi:Spy/CpxP family protein refolding chaperone